MGLYDGIPLSYLLNGASDASQESQCRVVKAASLGQEGYGYVLREQPDHPKKCDKTAEGRLVPGKLLSQVKVHRWALAIDKKNLNDENGCKQNDVRPKTVRPLLESRVESGPEKQTNIFNF